VPREPGPAQQLFEVGATGELILSIKVGDDQRAAGVKGGGEEGGLTRWVGWVVQLNQNGLIKFDHH